MYRNKNRNKRLARGGKSRQQRTFLMLELLIALFLVGMCLLPLVEFPMRAMRREVESSYRIHMQRLADLAFAEVKEQLYCQTIPWKDLIHPAKDKVQIGKKKSISLALEPAGKKQFDYTITAHSVGKKRNSGEEVRLVTFLIRFEPSQGQTGAYRKRAKRKFSTFTYQALVVKKPLEIKS